MSVENLAQYESFSTRVLNLNSAATSDIQDLGNTVFSIKSISNPDSSKAVEFHKVILTDYDAEKYLDKYRCSIQIIGKNKFNPYGCENTTLTNFNSKDCLVYTDGAEYFSYSEDFKESTSYTFQATMYRDEACVSEPCIIKVEYADGSIDTYNFYNNVNNSFITNNGKTLTKIRGNWNNEHKVYIDIDTLQLEEGPTKTECCAYNEYVENIYLDAPLTSDTPITFKNNDIYLGSKLLKTTNNLFFIENFSSININSIFKPNIEIVYPEIEVYNRTLEHSEFKDEILVLEDTNTKIVDPDFDIEVDRVYGKTYENLLTDYKASDNLKPNEDSEYTASKFVIANHIDPKTFIEEIHGNASGLGVENEDGEYKTELLVSTTEEDMSGRDSAIATFTEGKALITSIEGNTIYNQIDLEGPVNSAVPIPFTNGECYGTNTLVGHTVVTEVQGNTVLNAVENGNIEKIITEGKSITFDNELVKDSAVAYNGYLDEVEGRTYQNIVINGEVLNTTSLEGSSEELVCTYETLSLLPSTQYLVKLDKSDGELTLDLGGTKLASSEKQVSITTPATITENSLKIYGDAVTVTNVQMFKEETEILSKNYIDGIESVGIEDKKIYTGDFIELNEPRYNMQLVEVLGDTWQDSNSKNLFIPITSTIESSENSAKIIPSTYTGVSGYKVTAGEDSSIYRPIINSERFSFKTNVQYTFSCSVSNGTNTTTTWANLAIWYTDGTVSIATGAMNSRTFITSTAGKTVKGIGAYSGEFFVYNIQLEKGVVATDYEPYRQENLSNIISLGELYVDELKQPILDSLNKEQYKIEIKNKNQNIFNISEATLKDISILTMNASLKDRKVIFTNPESLRDNVAIFSNLEKVQPGESVYAYAKVKYDGVRPASGANFAIGLTTPTTWYSGQTVILRPTAVSGEYVLKTKFTNTYNTEQDIYLAGSMNGNLCGTVTFSDIIFSKSEINPDQADTTSILLPCQLMKIGNMTDKLYWDNNKNRYVVEKKIGNILLDGTEQWLVNNDTWGDGYIRFKTTKYNSLISQPIYGEIDYVCNKFKNSELIHSSEYENIHYNNSTETINIVIAKEKLSSLTPSGFVSWLQENNILVFYKMNNVELIETNITQPIIIAPYLGISYINLNKHSKLTNAAMKLESTNYNVNIKNSNTNNLLDWNKPVEKLFPDLSINSTRYITITNGVCKVKEDVDNGQLNHLGWWIDVNPYTNYKITSVANLNGGENYVNVYQQNTILCRIQVTTNIGTKVFNSGKYSKVFISPYQGNVSLETQYATYSNIYITKETDWIESMSITLAAFNETTIPLPQPLRAIGDYRDRLYYDREKERYCIERKIGYAVLDDKTDWGNGYVNSNYSTSRSGAQFPNLNSIAMFISDHPQLSFNRLYISQNYLKYTFGSDAPNIINVTLPTSIIPTSATSEWKNYFEQNPLKVYYNLETPETIDLLTTDHKPLSIYNGSNNTITSNLNIYPSKVLIAEEVARYKFYNTQPSNWLVCNVKGTDATYQVGDKTDTLLETSTNKYSIVTKQLDTITSDDGYIYFKGNGSIADVMITDCDPAVNINFDYDYYFEGAKSIGILKDDKTYDINIISKDVTNLNDGTVIAGKFINSDGSIANNAAWCYSAHYIRVDPNSLLYASHAGSGSITIYFCYYDINKKFVSIGSTNISNTYNQGFSTSASAYYLKLLIPINYSKLLYISATSSSVKTKTDVITINNPSLLAKEQTLAVTPTYMSTFLGDTKVFVPGGIKAKSITATAYTQVVDNLKPSTMYTIQFNCNKEQAESELTLKLGGTSLMIPYTEIKAYNNISITTPSTVVSTSKNYLEIKGYNHVISNVMVMEGTMPKTIYHKGIKSAFQNSNDIEFSGNYLSLPNKNYDGVVDIKAIEGNTVVNYCIGGDKELVLNNDIDLTGNSVTIADGIDGGLVDVICEGNTLVNVITSMDDLWNNIITKKDQYEYANEELIIPNNGNFDGTGWTSLKPIPNIKANTAYTLIFTKGASPKVELGCVINEVSKSYMIASNVNKLLFTSTSTGDVRIKFSVNNPSVNSNSINLGKVIILEGDWTNKEIPPYFEGMKSVGQNDYTGHKIELTSKVYTETKGESKTGEFIAYENSTTNDLIEVTEIWGNTIQSTTDLSDIQHLGELYVDELGQPILDDLSREQYKIEIESCNKNLLNTSIFTETNIGKGTGYLQFRLRPNTQYTLSFELSDEFISLATSQTNMTMRIENSTTKSNFLFNSNTLPLSKTCSKSITTNSDGIFIISFMAWNKVNLDYTTQVFNQFILNEGGNLEYIPRQSNKTTILLPCQLMKVGDVYDRLYWDSEKCKYVVEKKVFKHIFNNTGVYGSYTHTTDEYYSTTAPLVGIINDITLNSSFILNDDRIITIGALYRNNYYFKIKWSDLGVDEPPTSNHTSIGSPALQKFFTENNVEIYFSHKNSQLIETSITEQIKLPTYIDKTHVFVTGGIDGSINVDYIIRNGDITKINKKQILLNEPLRGLPNGVKDRFVKRDGKWYIERNCGEVDLGSEYMRFECYRLSDSYPDVIGFYLSPSNVKEVGGTGYRCLCNILPNITCNFPGIINHNNEGIDVNGIYIKGNIKRNKLTSLTVDGIRKYFKSVNAKIIHPLATSTYEPLNVTSELTTYLDSTYISNNSLMPCNMSIKNTGYNAIIKPSTLYTVIANTQGTGTFGVNLGGTKLTTATNKLTITTPATLTEDMLRLHGKGLKAKNVRVLEGDCTTLDYPYFEGLRSTFDNVLVTQAMVDSGEELVENLGKYKCNVKVRGKNLFDCILESGTIMENYLGINPKSRRSKNYTECIPLKQYTLSKTGNAYGSICIFNNNKIYTRGYMLIGNFSNSRTFTLNENEKYIKFYSDSINEEWKLEEGTIATPFEPFCERSETVYVNSPFLKGDELVAKNDGLYHLHNKTQVILNGSENWTVRTMVSGNDNSAFRFSIYDSDYYKKALYYNGINYLNGISDKFSSSKWIEALKNDVESIYVVGYNSFECVIQINKSKLSTQDAAGFKQWLQANPTTIVYELAEPYYEKISNETITLKAVSGSNLSLNSYIPIPKTVIGSTISLTANNDRIFISTDPLRAIGSYKDRLYIENGKVLIERKIGNKLKVLGWSSNYNEIGYWELVPKVGTLLTPTLVLTEKKVISVVSNSKVGEFTVSNNRIYIATNKLVFPDTVVEDLVPAVQSLVDSTEIYYVYNTSVIEDTGLRVNSSLLLDYDSNGITKDTTVPSYSTIKLLDNAKQLVISLPKKLLDNETFKWDRTDKKYKIKTISTLDSSESYVDTNITTPYAINTTSNRLIAQYTNAKVPSKTRLSNLNRLVKCNLKTGSNYTVVFDIENPVGNIEVNLGGIVQTKPATSKMTFYATSVTKDDLIICGSNTSKISNIMIFENNVIDTLEYFDGVKSSGYYNGQTYNYEVCVYSDRKLMTDVSNLNNLSNI